ncbi:PstS family phosphate ABC transporter substrate-binding protein [Amphibacillus sp. MSJ-3]|nr:PstS family phosphate ABC transporter substrate-binding protein [Amphibacillus sp. MSJ-3]MBU5593564.1 PstS family phosphate ABC transporter substrate-binding protein [Amphibacillus sp. MSJ-3]
MGFLMFFLLLIFIVACSGRNDDPNALSGRVAIDGSGTVYPLMARVAEEYMSVAQQGVSVEVSRSGTSAGFQKFIVPNGTDFNNASREINKDELRTAFESEVDIKELKVALDGLTFVIHPDNDWATELTNQEVANIFRADSEINYWSDINSDWPKERINTYGPNENHGTYEFFYESILEEADLKEDVNLQQDYSTLLTLISEDKNAIGFFGFGYYINNQEKITAIHIDFGDGPIEPSFETISEDGDYAEFTRPVFTYLNLDSARTKPEVLDFSIFLMEHVNTFAGARGFAPLPDEEIEAEVEFLKGL